jgi:hypothetical protein
MFLAVNLVFAGLYLAVGAWPRRDRGRSPTRSSSASDAGHHRVRADAPRLAVANLLVTVEALFGLVLTALATGLVFAKFSVVHPGSCSLGWRSSPRSMAFRR